ncbi:Selenoprotein T1b [Anabarilius grahami]|uniref:Selenoprotein T n=1 Tax=Anabarilius grahami TaxID=495550 RepID=A0A3N0XQX2_ANAGA|nr:Selenoprotein T1b [Anabarilius grahami]
METRCLYLLLVCVLSVYPATADNGSVKKMKMQYTGMPLLKFQIWRVFEEYSRVLTQRYPDIRIEGENFLPQPFYRHIASFLSVFKFVVIGLVILGKDPFTFFHMEAPGIWLWAQENKMYACMMVFFLSNMIENQCMSTGAFEITLNDVPVWSKLQSGHLPSMQQLVQILENEMKLSAHMDSLPHRRA